MQLLLISNSYNDNGGYFGYYRQAINNLLRSEVTGHVLFIPYALKDLDRYTTDVRKFFETEGHTLKSIHEYDNPLTAIKDPGIKAIFIGGGNTFRLLKTLQDNNLIDAIRSRVQEGISYIGSSAGTVVACPTIKTTNDMPIVKPRDFDALGLVDFQINPHFIPGKLMSSHQGETREERIKQYHEENDYPVIGLPEATWIVVSRDSTKLVGKKDAVIFEKAKTERLWKLDTELKLV